jgi:hypothetical protein
MPKPGDAIHIPLPEDGAIRLALRVKPNDSMPKPGAHAMGPKRKRGKKRRKA